MKQVQSEPPKQTPVTHSSSSDPPTPLSKQSADQARRSELRQPEPPQIQQPQQQSTPVSNQPQPSYPPPSQPDVNRLVQTQSFSAPSTPLRTPFSSMEYRQPMLSQPPMQFSSSGN